MRKVLSLKFLIALILLTALAALPVYAQNGRGQGLEIAIAAQERHTEVLMANPGVVGIGVGLNTEGDPAVIILTETRGVRGLPRTLDGVPVVMRQAGRIFALHHRSWHGGGEEDTGGTPEPGRTDRWLRPVPIGISTGHPDITAGTIGARVIDGGSGAVFALSNNHVYAIENQAVIPVCPLLSLLCSHRHRLFVLSVGNPALVRRGQAPQEGRCFSLIGLDPHY